MTVQSSVHTPYTVVDVGCRWGCADVFAHNPSLFRVFGFDPDIDECHRLEAHYRSPAIRFVPLALADYEGQATLYVTKEPGCSSLHRPRADLVARYPALDCMRQVGEEQIPVTTLANWARSAAVTTIDYVKLDVQGAELAVLKGAGPLLSRTRCLQVEVEFNELYEGQPLFADVDSFLRRQGFSLLRFTNLIHYGWSAEETVSCGSFTLCHNDQNQSSTMAGGQLFWADAHYVREEIVQGVGRSVEALERDIPLLEAVGHLDLALRLRKVLDVQ